MIAVCLIRKDPTYRRDAFVHGLKRAGYRVTENGHPTAKEDFLVIWNRYGSNEAMADSWERGGGTVIVCENGYLGKDSIGRQYYALAVHGHNGSGWFPVGAEDRFEKLGVEVKPWTSNLTGYALICGQRGIGSRTMASPPNWHERMADRLRPHFGPVKVRAHPGNRAPSVPLDDDLVGAKACVIWSSSAGVQALVAGVPVSFDAPKWICEDAAIRVPPYMPLKMDDAARLDALRRMAWGQRSVEELESGEVFIRIRDNLAFAKW